MKVYDPSQILVSIHVPKCAGTSFTQWLRTAFVNQVHLHYPDQNAPEKCTHSAGWCVHGHFYHHAWNIGAKDYYPDVHQYITVLRDPLQMVISSYFFMNQLGQSLAPTLESYLDYVLINWPRLTHFAGLPIRFDADDLWEQIEQNFVWVGVVEQFDICLPLLASLLGVRNPSMPVENISLRSRSLVSIIEWQDRFREKFSTEYQLYDNATLSYFPCLKINSQINANQS